MDHWGSGWAAVGNEMGKVVGVSVKILEDHGFPLKGCPLKLLGDPCKASCVMHVIGRIAFTIGLYRQLSRNANH